jgi:hypothetical protein
MPSVGPLVKCASLRGQACRAQMTHLLAKA